MFEAQYLIAGDLPRTVFSPWFPRQGDCIRYTIDVIDVDDTQITVTLFHKNSEDSGDGTSASSSLIANTTGRMEEEFATGLKELVRYQFTIDEAETPPGWILFRMLPPVWFDATVA